MLRQVVLLFAIFFTTTQAFSWGRVFTNENKNEINRPLERVTPPQTQEEAEAERPLPGAVQEERTFHNAGADSSNGLPRFSEDSTLREGTPVSGVQAGEEELATLRKEVSEIREPLGPESPQKVEVIGVPKVSEHHVTDGLADAIAGLMRVYNALVHTDGYVHPEVSGVVNGTDGMESENGTMEEGVRTAGEVGKGGGRWGAVVVLGGVILAAVIGLVLTGFGGNRERESVLYPPRGPAYV